MWFPSGEVSGGLEFVPECLGALPPPSGHGLKFLVFRGSELGRGATAVCQRTLAWREQFFKDLMWHLSLP